MDNDKSAYEKRVAEAKKAFYEAVYACEHDWFDEQAMSRACAWPIRCCKCGMNMFKFVIQVESAQTEYYHVVTDNVNR